MPPEIAGLAPRTNLIFSPATAGAVTDGCEGIIQPGWQKLAAFRRGQKCLKKIFARPVFAIFATTASFLRATSKQIKFNILFNICHVIMQFLTMKHYCCPKKHFFCSKSPKKCVYCVIFQDSVCCCLKFSSKSKLFSKGPSRLCATSLTLSQSAFLH